MTIVARTLAGVLAVAGLATVSGICQSQPRCPWLNAATAAGVLGGDVQMTVTAPVDPGSSKGVGAAAYPDQVRMDRFDVSCDFTRKADSGVYTLSIVVKTMKDPAKDFALLLAPCGASSAPLRGIGNEAIQCARQDSAHAGWEQVVARVRDRAFLLSILREPKAAASAGELSDETRNVAEQVAGSLF